jgi:hypothetical protein
MVYFCEEDGVKYAVYPTEEMSGGTFNPATKIASVDGLLFFGTANGDLCVFNTDKRGMPPNQLRMSDDFDEKSYKKSFGRCIHPSYYSFANHAPRYALKTKLDNCSIPHLLKDTVKHSLTMKYKSLCRGEIICEVNTDGNGYSEACRFPGGAIAFDDLDFSSICFNTDSSFTAPISEKEKAWVEKSISLYSDQFCSPFGIYNVSYRFTVRGKIKKNR